MKYLIIGLGNIGLEYRNTRHNIGFQILDALAGASNIIFEQKKYARIFSVLEECLSVDPNFILADPSTVLIIANEAVNNNLNDLAYRIVKRATERYKNHEKLTDLTLIEANLLWCCYDKADDAKKHSVQAF